VVGGREKLLTIVEPVGATVSDAKWTSSNPSVATVNEKGTINALTVGQTTITLTSGNKPTEQYTLSVIASPIADLVMPEIDYPIAKEAIVILQGTGFTTNDKIWLRKVTGSGLTLKSAQTGDDILAQIHEQAANYISFYCSATPGWYSVILEKDNTQYELGNMDVETPNIPEYVYDKNKIFWDDTHWRRFQLRGKVKEMTTTEIYYPYWSTTTKYTFNKNGFLETFGSSTAIGKTIPPINSVPSTTYQYDNYNRLIKKTDSGLVDDLGRFDSMTSDYTYGDHSLYLPIDYTLDIQFEPTDYNCFYFGGGDYQQRYNLEMWQKGLIGIKGEKHYTSGKTETTNYQFVISGKNINANSTNNIDSYKENYTWNYMAETPYKAVEITIYTDGSIGTRTITYQFSSINMPINKQFDHSTVYYSASQVLKYIQNCPFTLFSSYDDSKGGGLVFNCEYDKNWDIIKYDTDYDKTTFNYISYDVQGNWTQCVVLQKNNNSGSSSINKLTRDITYW